MELHQIQQDLAARFARCSLLWGTVLALMLGVSVASAQDKQSQPEQKTAPPPQQKPQVAKPDFAAAARRVAFSGFSGPSANHPQAIAMIKMWKEKLPVMLEHIYDMTGLFLPSNGRVFVQLIEGDGGLNYGLTKRGGGGCIITMSIGNIIKHKKDPYTMFQHELVHVMLIYWMQGRDRMYPLWLHEGIASFVGGNGPDFVRMYYLMYRGKFGNDRDKTIAFMLNGFGVHKYPLDYAEDYLGFLYMWETWGPEGFKEFIRLITTGGMDWQSAIIRVSRMSWKDFYEAAWNFSVRYIRELDQQVKKEEAEKKVKLEVPESDKDPTGHDTEPVPDGK